MDLADIEELTVKQKQQQDAKKNKEFDDTVAGGTLEDLRKGVDIKKKMLDQINSIGFEVGANVGLDKATNWLLAAPFPGARLLYGGANFLGSAGINLYAQRIRGEEGIKWGEAAASGGMSLVPYMPFAAGKYTKYLGEPWSVQRGVVGGAVTGVGHEAIRVGIDEKRLPSPIETGLGATVGGAVGGAIPAAADTAKRMIAQIQGVMPMGKLAYGVGAGEAPLDDIKRSIIKSNLESDIVTRFLLGKTTKLPKQHRTLIQNSALGQVTDADFKGTSGVSVPLRPGYIPTTEAYTNYIARLDQLIEEFPNLKNKFEGLKGSFLWNEHHINPRTAPLDFYVGRTDVADRNKIRDLLVDEFNIFSGNSPLNRIGLPTGLEEADVHSMVHEWLAPRLGERSDVLKAKWAKEVGLKLGPLQTRQGGRQGYLAGQQYLSDADRVTWNNYMSQLPVDGKLMKRFIREYGAIIKESEVLIERLMKQFDAFYRVPKSYQVEVTPDDLVAVLDNIDPTKEITLPLVERTIREVLEDKKLNMINPVTKEIVGVVQKSEKELNMLFRSDDLLSMLDAANKPGWTGSNKQIDSWAKELNEIYMELGIFPKGQLSFDIQKGKISSYLEKMKKARFGDTTLSEIDKPITKDPKIQDLIDE